MKLIAFLTDPPV